MKKGLVFIASAAVSIMLASQLTLAATVKVAANVNTPIAVSQIIQNLEAKGYVGIREIELEDNVYKADVVTAEGEVLDVKINPMTGEMMGSVGAPKHLSVLEVAKKVEEAGYRIIKIKADGESYKVKALDKEGKKASLKVNASSGEISKKWFD